MAQTAIPRTTNAPPVSTMERIWSRASWIVLVFLLGFTLLCVTLGTWLLTQPGDGCQLAANTTTPQRVAACWGTWPTPLRLDDQIVAVNGVPIGGGTDNLEMRATPPPPGWSDGAIANYTVQRDGELLTLDVPLDRLGTPEILRVFGAALVGQLRDFILPIFLGSLVIFLLAPRSDAAHLLLMASGPLFMMTTFVSAADTVSTQFVTGPAWVLRLTVSSLWGWLFVPTLLLLVLNFPRRVWPVRRWPRRAATVMYGLPIAAWIVTLLSGGAELYVALLALNALAVVCCTIGITLHTMLRVRDPVLRAQTAWMALGVGAGFALIPLLWSLTVLMPGFNDALSRLPTWGEVLLNVAIGLSFPLSMGIAITRYRLFDIDVILNRALVYGTLTAFVIGVYVGIVSYASTLLQGQQSIVPPLIATGLVAVLFQPLRERVQRSVDRLMYGERDDPYAVLARLGQRLEGALAVDTLLPTIAETVAQALRLPYVAIALPQGDGMQNAAEYVAQSITQGTSAPAPAVYILPLVVQGETVGELRLAHRPGEHEWNAADQRLLNALSRQAGIAVQSARLTVDLRHLTVDLQQSRERLVTAREEERRRLRRDLHDGLGPSLASLTFKVDAARNLLRRDLAKADRLLEDVAEQMQTTIADIRRLVYDLRPPALDQLGLVAALKQHTVHLDSRTRIFVQAPDDLPSLPAAVEVAAYRITLEAVTNVLRHAEARQCTVSITVDRHTLVVDIRDDGRGVPMHHHPGVGLRSMYERAAELGGTCTVETLTTGGTLVQAHLPLAASNTKASEG
ncbi:MAG: hypothetical protein H7Z42_17425 [Roseiflexaceae bacterium]|nr:hypothetical protein [Roseiflexaceae bacterium]